MKKSKCDAVAIEQEIRKQINIVEVNEKVSVAICFIVSVGIAQ